MKKLFVLSILSAVTLLTSCTSNNHVSQDNNIRIMTGIYHDYMVVTTMDGNDWFIDDSNPSDNLYMAYDADYGHYDAIYHEAELLQVVFNTKGTTDILDDEIMRIRSIDRNYK